MALVCSCSLSRIPREGARKVPSRAFLFPLPSHEPPSFEPGSWHISPKSVPLGYRDTRRQVKPWVDGKSFCALPNDFFAVSEQCGHHVRERASQTHQVKLSLCKITTRHGNDPHSVLTKEPQFDTHPSGPILVSFSDAGKKEKAKQSSVAAIRRGRPLATPRA